MLEFSRCLRIRPRNHRCRTIAGFGVAADESTAVSVLGVHGLRSCWGWRRSGSRRGYPHEQSHGSAGRSVATVVLLHTPGSVRGRRFGPDLRENVLQPGFLVGQWLPGMDANVVPRGSHQRPVTPNRCVLSPRWPMPCPQGVRDLSASVKPSLPKVPTVDLGPGQSRHDVGPQRCESHHPFVFETWGRLSSHTSDERRAVLWS